MAAGGAAILAPIVAPLVARIVRESRTKIAVRGERLLPALLVVACAAYGIYRIAPRTYPVEQREHHRMVGPLLALRERPLKNAIVIVERGRFQPTTGTPLRMIRWIRIPTTDADSPQPDGNRMRAQAFPWSHLVPCRDERNPAVLSRGSRLRLISTAMTAANAIRCFAAALVSQPHARGRPRSCAYSERPMVPPSA